MKELKFRAWNNRMYYDVVPLSNTEIIEVLSLTGHARVQHVVEVMQFTGLKDKTGLEIYEGDIINGYYTKSTIFTGKVIFTEGSFCLLIYKRPDNCLDYDVGQTPELNNFEKIVKLGNVYENPELLSEKTEVKK